MRFKQEWEMLFFEMRTPQKYTPRFILTKKAKGIIVMTSYQDSTKANKPHRSLIHSRKTFGTAN